MTKKNLIPLGQPGNEEHDKKVRSKLKGSSSPKRKIAQKINGLKHANPDRLPEKISKIISDPNLSAKEIMLIIEFIKSNALSGDIKNDDLIKLGNLMVKAHTALFGSKTYNVNLNKSITSPQTLNEIYLEVQNEKSNEHNELNGEGNIKESNKREKRKISG